WIMEGLALHVVTGPTGQLFLKPYADCYVENERRNICSYYSISNGLFVMADGRLMRLRLFLLSLPNVLALLGAAPVTAQTLIVRPDTRAEILAIMFRIAGAKE